MCAPARLHTRHPDWCQPAACSVHGVDPVHVAPAGVDLDMPGADDVRFFRVDEHHVHTGAELPPVYGVELLVPLDAAAVADGVVRVMLSEEDLSRLAGMREELGVLRERDQQG